MKKYSLALVVVMLGFAGVAQAHSYKVDNAEFADPLRLFALPVHAAGTLVELTVTRPVHWAVSQPYMRRLFGHVTTRKDVYSACEDDLQHARW